MGPTNENGPINVKIDGNGNNEFDITNQTKTARSKNVVQPKELKTGFLTAKAKLAFIELRQAFIKALILYHFNLKYQIQIETDILGYVISGILSQLTIDNLD